MVVDNILKIGYREPEFYIGKAWAILTEYDDITIEYIESHSFETHRISIQSTAESVILALRYGGLEEKSREKIRRESGKIECIECSNFSRKRIWDDALKKFNVMGEGRCSHHKKTKDKFDKCADFKKKIAIMNVIRLEKIGVLKAIRERVEGQLP